MPPKSKKQKKAPSPGAAAKKGKDKGKDKGKKQEKEQEESKAGAISRGTLDWGVSWAEIEACAIKPLIKILDTGGLQDRKVTALFKPKEYVAIYTLAYSLCTQRAPHNHSDKLFAKHSEVIGTYLSKTVLPALRAQPSGDALLTELGKRWANHQVMSEYMRRFCSYLDRYYVSHAGVKGLLETSMDIFREQVYGEIKGEVSAALLALVAREREGEAIDQGLIAAAVDTLDHMGEKAYLEDLEAPLLEASKAFYAAKAQEWLATDDTPGYLLKAERALAAEAARVRAYLHGATEKALVPVVVEELLGRHVHALVDREGSGCAALLAQDKFDDLARMVRLFRRVGHPTGGVLDDGEEEEEPTSAHRGLAPVAAAFKAHVESLGQQVIDATSSSCKGGGGGSSKGGGGGGKEKGKGKEEGKPGAGGGGEEKGGGKGKEGGKEKEGPSSASAVEAAGAAYIKGLLAIHETYAGIVAQHFDGSNVFAKALKEAFQLLVNKGVMDGQRTSAELMAAFCNRLLAKGGEKLADAEVEAYLDKVMALFSYLQDKDVYLDAYSSTLAKRLLQEKSSSADWEKLMISKLKGRMGPSFVSRLEGMMSDLAISRDTMAAWAQQESVKGSVPLRGFTARVLTQGIWPSSMGRGPGGDAADVLLPQEMAASLDKFKKWYIHRNPGRRLNANHLLGQVEVRATFFPASGSGGGKSYDAGCAPLQAIILLAFQGLKCDETLSLAALAERTHLNVADLKPLLHSLACAKYKLLAKTPPGGKGINDGDLFSGNKAFSCPKRFFALQLPDVTRAHNPARLEEDRGIVIDAAIVRVAKARRLISHNELLAEVTQQILNFKAQPAQIKKRIAGLIEKEYLERDPADRSVYRYMP